MKKIFGILLLALVSLGPLSARASVVCQNFTWTQGNPASFTYTPGTSYGPTGIIPYLVKMRIECARTAGEPDIEIQFGPTIIPTATAKLGAAQLGFGYTNNNDCTNLIRPSRTEMIVRLDPWAVSGLSNFQTFEFTLPSGQSLGFNVCVSPTPVFPMPPGTYTSSDTWRFSIWSAGGSSQRWPAVSGTWDTSPGSLPVNITVPPHCVMSLSASLITILYPSFSSADVNGTPTVQASAQCNVDYQMSITPATSTAAGVQYTLTVTKAGNVVVNPTDWQTATGAVQNYNINAKALAGQAGDCSTGCTGSVVHTLLVTFN
jgi:hypothetical protein